MRPWIPLLLLLAAPVQAANLIVPVAQPGTELVIANLQAEAAPLVITYYGGERHRVIRPATLAAYGTIALDDVPADAAMIRVSSAQEGTQFTAEAGNLPAAPVDALATEHVLSGNVVVANPWSVPASLVVTMNDAQTFRIVDPMDVLAIDATGATVHITSQVGVYAYDDRSFTIGTGPVSTVTPRCAEPAALTMTQPAQASAEGWLVLMNPDTSVNTLQAALPARHGYMPLGFYAELPGFIAELTPDQIAALRCEPSVQLIAQNVAH